MVIHGQKMSNVCCVIAVLVFLVAACSREETPVRVDLSKKADVSLKREGDAITYAYLPQYAHRISYERHNPVIQYLKEETGLGMEQVFPDTFDEHIKMVGQGKIDISFSNPVAYVEMAGRFGARAFARIVELDGKADFRGQIICRSDNQSIRTLQDCRGKRWIAVDPSSAGGYMFALGHFHENGIKKGDFAEVAFAPGPGGKSEKVVLAVHAGKYDVGSVREGTLNVVADKIDVGEIRVIATTRWYPGWVYAARKDLDPAIVEKVKTAFLKLDKNNSEHRKILDAARMSGIIASADSDFDPVRSLMRNVGVSLGNRVE